MGEKSKKAKIIKINAISFFLIILFSVLLYFAVGPRFVNDSGELYEIKVYYMGNYYHGAYFQSSGKDKAGACIKPGFFQRIHKVQGNDDKLLIVMLHENLVLVKDKKSDNDNKENDLPAVTEAVTEEKKTFAPDGFDYNALIYDFKNARRAQL